MDATPGGKVISSILKHDSKQTSYKIALVRAINDVALSYPAIGQDAVSVAVPLRYLAEYWLAYYFPFVDGEQPIFQGARPMRSGGRASDMAFRPQLSRFAALWRQFAGDVMNPADGFYLINELRLDRKRSEYPVELRQAYSATLKAIEKTLLMPIRYAGPAGHQWSVFSKPASVVGLDNTIVQVPGARPDDICLVVDAELWQAFRELSLWIEALCLHEWCLFTERISRGESDGSDRGTVYRLLTARPDNRRPLTWERNQVELLLRDGHEFQCPWTGRSIRFGVRFDLDHILPLAVYPINELWNLVPADPDFNSHTKRDRLPSITRLNAARVILTHTYRQYSLSSTLDKALRGDVGLRFGDVRGSSYAEGLADAVTQFVHDVGEARNLAHF